MIPIFGPDGALVGWRSDDAILDLDNECRAFLSDQAVISYDGDYLGQFHNGFFRDIDGNVVA